MMRKALGLRALVGALFLTMAIPAAIPAGVAAAEAIEAAFQRMLASNEEVLDVLEAIDGPESLEAQRGVLIAALEEAEADAGEVTEYMAEAPVPDAILEVYGPQVEAHYARRAEVQEALVERLDPDTLDAVEAILMGVR